MDMQGQRLGFCRNRRPSGLEYTRTGRPVHRGLVDALGLTLDERGNVTTDQAGATSREGVFAAGDTSSGASLVVRAIYAGRQMAEGIDRWLRTQ